jgi:hypothetical protein
MELKKRDTVGFMTEILTPLMNAGFQDENSKGYPRRSSKI